MSVVRPFLLPTPAESCGVPWVDQFRQVVRELHAKYSQPSNVVAFQPPVAEMQERAA